MDDRRGLIMALFPKFNPGFYEGGQRTLAGLAGLAEARGEPENRQKKDWRYITYCNYYSSAGETKNSESEETTAKVANAAKVSDRAGRVKRPTWESFSPFPRKRELRPIAPCALQSSGRADGWQPCMALIPATALLA
jgi:hypothetical protein